MDHFDDLPKRGRNHAIEEAAVAAFQKLLSESGVFILQSTDRKDYGTDCQIEVVDQERATNVRIHVQLKGTERPVNADGSISVEASRRNLNYLLMHPYSFYVCYHGPSQSLRICFAENILRQYEHGKKNWIQQQTLTVIFEEPLTQQHLQRLAALARTGATQSRDRRTHQATAEPADVPGILRSSTPDVHVPEDTQTASQLLAQLYESGADEIICAAFEKFTAVLGVDSDAIGPAYLAEINVGMAQVTRSHERIEAAIAYFQSRLDGGHYQVGSLHYAIGNAFSALGDEERAKAAYELALADADTMRHPSLAAQYHKNLGSSLEKLGQQEKAVEHFHDALRMNPNLAEAHHALGNYYHRIGRYEEALAHFDRVVFTDRELGQSSSVAGWRVNILFNLEDGRAAFRQINSLLSEADSTPWIWPWCAREVANFGRTTTSNAQHALVFWQRFLDAHPDSSTARRELLLTALYLRSQGEDIGKTYDEFRDEFDVGIQRVDAEDAPFLWDRLGHWAQDEGNWTEAERCFRRAYELEGGHYGYCLGTALNFLGRSEESLPILLEQAQTIQADAMSWCQLGCAYQNLNRLEDAIEAFEKALSLDENYDLAAFNLGGAYWNSGDVVQAERVWRMAVERFPDHELAADLREKMPFLTL